MEHIEQMQQAAPEGGEKPQPPGIRAEGMTRAELEQLTPEDRRVFAALGGKIIPEPFPGRS